MGIAGQPAIQAPLEGITKVFKGMGLVAGRASVGRVGGKIGPPIGGSLAVDGVEVPELSGWIGRRIDAAGVDGMGLRRGEREGES